MHTSTTSTSELMPWTADELQQATHGIWYLGRLPEAPIKRILTDSRYAEQGDAFLALKGERFDAHDFIGQVSEQNCKVAIVERPVKNADIAQLIVPDTRLALGLLGGYRRALFPQLKVIALTGSSGKTTTKEMLGSILGRLGPVLVTRGNLNNDLGVPMMLLELTAEHQYAVMELGANHIGEIDYTSNLVQPDVAGILNIGTAHMGEFGGRDAICKAKSEIYSHIALNGTAILPASDDFSQSIKDAVKTEKQIMFGDTGHVYAKNIQLSAQASLFDLYTPNGSIAITLPFAGLHNVYNATAAAAFALALNISLADIADGLKQAKGAKGRLNFIEKDQYLFIDDTYNANPTSMRAAAEVLAQQPHLKVMVMGDIGELGEAAIQEHHDLGKDLVHYNIDHIIAVGEYAQYALQGAKDSQHAHKIQAFATQEDALKCLIHLAQQHQHNSMSFLFKGSRYTHMETLMTDLMENI